MFKQLMSALIVSVLAVAIAIIASIFGAANALAVSSTIYVQGTKTVDSPFPTQDEINMSKWVEERSDGNVALLDYPRTMWPVPNLSAVTFDVSTAIGVQALYDAIVLNPGEKVIYGHSQGAAVQSMIIEDHVAGNRPNMPVADQLSFVMVSNPSRPNGGILSRFAGLKIPLLDITFHGPTPNSEYAVLDISKQYDAVSDFPVRPFNILALVNAALGYAYLHGDYSEIDLNDPENTVQVSGNTTYITIPTKQLPLLQPVRDVLSFVGRKETPLLDAIEPGLKRIIESAYDRSPVDHLPAQIISRPVESGRLEPNHAFKATISARPNQSLVVSKRNNTPVLKTERPCPEAIGNTVGLRRSSERISSLSSARAEDNSSRITKRDRR